MNKEKEALHSATASLLADYEAAEGNPSLEAVSIGGKDIFAAEKRHGWQKAAEARCNFEWRPRITPRAGLWFVSLWQKSVTGRTLTDIKSDPAEVEHFARAVSDFLTSVLGQNLRAGQWSICTTPKRRHKERNFATLICMDMAGRLQIPFYEDVALCHSRQRINAVFTLNRLPEEPNVIVFDDFVTTGSTLKGMNGLLSPLGKTLLFAAGINNST